MRIWSLHPKYLDSKGLVALWRETLLAKHVLEGRTIGYRNHPQLIRFKNTDNAVGYINQYLLSVYENAVQRGYHFDKSKFEADFSATKLTVTEGQIKYETNHLLKKLETRDLKLFHELSIESKIEAHPLFKIVDGEKEEWEIIERIDQKNTSQ